MIKKQQRNVKISQSHFRDISIKRTNTLKKYFCTAPFLFLIEKRITFTALHTTAFYKGVVTSALLCLHFLCTTFAVAGN